MLGILKKAKKILNNERGDILQWIIVIVVIIAVAVKVMPGLMNGITAQGTTAVNSIGTIPSLIAP